jgi:hypothetical protein
LSSRSLLVNSSVTALVATHNIVAFEHHCDATFRASVRQWSIRGQRFTVYFLHRSSLFARRNGSEKGGHSYKIVEYANVKLFELAIHSESYTQANRNIRKHSIHKKKYYSREATRGWAI